MDESQAAKLIANTLARHWNEDRARTRERACDEARRLIASKLGKLRREDFERVFALLHADHSHGREVGGRFGQALVGKHANRMLAHPDALNEWTMRLWSARDDEDVAKTLDAFYAVGKSQLPGAGRSFPTSILYVRGPERYWPLFTGPERGYERLSGASVGSSGQGYIDYVCWLRGWREREKVPTHAVDLVLAVIGSPDGEAHTESDDDANASAGDEPEPKRFELRVELCLFERRVCKVRLAGQTSWPQAGHVLPPLLDLHDIAARGDARELDDLGRQLFAASLGDAGVVDSYRQQREQAKHAGAPLRIALCMRPDGDEPARPCSIAGYFWELLVDPDHGPVAIDQNLRLIRTHAKHGTLTAPKPSAPLRVNVGLANPRDEALLDLAAEWTHFDALRRSLADASVLALDVHGQLDLSKFESLIHASDVFHYAGHGEAGGLLLEDAARNAKPLSSDAMRAIMRESVPTVVVLNACHGATSRAGVISVAEAFLSNDVPVVVAMNGEVSDNTAVAFARELYMRLAAGVDVEQAVQRARWLAFAERTPSWFLPVMWTRLESTICLVDPTAARGDEVVQGQVVALDRRVAELRSRVELLQRLAAKDVEVEHRDELAESLLAQAEDPAALERVLDDEHEITRQLKQLRRRDADPQAELRAFASTLRRELVPQLGAAAQALREAARPVAMEGERPSAPALDSRPFASSQVLSFHGSLDAFVDGILDESKLQLDRAIVRRCVLHLMAGRHLVLSGPPGTGKSSLAKALARAFGHEPHMATANPDWTTFDTIGGIAPHSVHGDDGRTHLSYAFRPGKVMQAVEDNWRADGEQFVPAQRRSWLIIDEMNRAPLDQAFGDLFTALVEGQLADPRRVDVLPIPLDFRLICTTNTADRRLLFEFSEALKRRFAFVEIPAHPEGSRKLGDRDKLREQLRKRDVLQGLSDVEDELFDVVEPIIERVRVLFPLGLAQVLDVLTYVAVGLQHAGPEARDALVDEALVDNLLPLLESQSPALLDALACLLDGSIGRWIDGFVERSAYRAEPEPSRIAGLLLGHAVGPDVNWQAIIDAAPGLARARALAGALRRVVAEQHG